MTEPGDRGGPEHRPDHRPEHRHGDGPDHEPDDHPEGDPSYRRTHDHLIEPFFGGLHGDGSATPDSEDEPDAPEPRWTLRVVRSWIRVILIRGRGRA